MSGCTSLTLGCTLNPSSLFFSLCDVIQFRWRVTSHTSTKRPAPSSAKSLWTLPPTFMATVRTAWRVSTRRLTCRLQSVVLHHRQSPTSQFQKATVANRTYKYCGAKWYQPRVSSVASSHPPAPFSRTVLSYYWFYSYFWKASKSIYTDNYLLGCNVTWNTIWPIWRSNRLESFNSLAFLPFF